MRRKNVSITAEEIARLCDGKLEGDPSSTITMIGSLDQENPSALAFIRVSSTKKVEQAIADRRLAALLVPESLGTLNPSPSIPALIHVRDPLEALVKLIPVFFDTIAQQGISPLASIDPSAQIGNEVSIGAYCSIGPDVRINDNTTLHPHVTIYEGATIGRGTVIHSGAVVREFCTIGNDCTLHNNTIIGADGFGYIPDPNFGLVKVPQIGTVIIGDRVEIGANSCIDRGTFGDTVIGEGTKIDNLCQVGHNVVTGKNCIICGQAGIAGSVTMENGVVIGGNVGIADHVTIVSGVRVAGNSGVHRSLTEPGDYAGFPIRPAKEWRREAATLIKIAKRNRE